MLWNMRLCPQKIHIKIFLVRVQTFEPFTVGHRAGQTFLYANHSVWPFVIELKYLLHFIKVGFTSFPTGQFTTVAIVNPPDGKLTDPLNNGIVNGKVDCPINFETCKKVCS